MIIYVLVKFIYRRITEPADYYPCHDRFGASFEHISAPSVNACAIFRVQYIHLIIVRTMVYSNGLSVVGAKSYGGSNVEPSS